MVRNNFVFILIFFAFSVYAQDTQEISLELKSGNFIIDTDLDLTRIKKVISEVYTEAIECI